MKTKKQTKNYTPGSLRILAAGLINGHELSPEAQRAAGKALADYAELLDKFSKGGRMRAPQLVAENRAKMKTDPAAGKNRERVSRHRAKKAE